MIKSEIFGWYALRIAIGTLLIFLAIGGANALPSGLVAEYHFNGNVLDSSGNGNNGNMYGNPIFVPGMEGQALSFDGVDDYITDIPSLGTPDKMTVEFWLKIGEIQPSGEHVILGFLNPDSWQIFYTDKNFYYFNYYSLDQYGNFLGYANPGIPIAQLPLNDWVFMSITYEKIDSNSAITKLYINGVLKQTDSNTLVMTPIDGDSRNIGRNPNGNYAKITIDDVRIYHAALSADEIQSEYSSYVTPTPPVPELSTIALVGSGMFGLIFITNRKW